MPTLYTFGNAANVSANNFTTLYNSGAGVVNPQLAYGNANVEDFLALGTDGGNTIGNIIASGNITADFFLGNIVGNIVGNLNVPGGNTQIIFNNAGNAGASANLTFDSATGIMNVTGNVTATGNIASSFFLGNGRFLTGLPEAYGNANVAAYLASGNLTSNISTTGNITGGFYFGNVAFASGLSAGATGPQGPTGATGATGPQGPQGATGATGTFNGVLTSNVDGNGFSISNIGLIAAADISTSGNVTVNGTLNSDDITSSNVTVYGDQVITGNLTVQGTTTTINSNVITTNDKTITVANNQSTGANVNGAGLEAGNPAIATWLYNAATDSWQSNIAVTPIANLAQDLGKNSNRWSTVYSSVVDASGNIVTAGYFIGNGSQLTGVVSDYGNANVAANLAAFANNPISTSGNITGGNINTGYVNFGSGYGNLNGGELYLGNTNGVYQNLVRMVANQNIGYLQVGNTGSNGSFRFSKWLSANTAMEINTANNRVGINKTSPTVELDVAGQISATGNITGSYILGNGSQLTGLPATYSNANVAAYLASGTNTSNIITTGNSQSGNISATGSVVAVSYGFAGSPAELTQTSLLVGNADGYVRMAGGVGAGGVPISYIQTGNATANGILRVSKYFSSNTTVEINTETKTVIVDGLISATGNISTTANVAGAFILGNGSQLTGLPASYSNAQVAALLAAFGSNTIVTTGNITGGNFIGSGAYLTSLPAGNITGTVGLAQYVTQAAQGNITSLGTLTGVSATGNISTTGNITGNYILGNGSQLTGIVSDYGNSNVAAYLASGTNSSNIITTATLQGALANITGTGNTFSVPNGNAVLGKELFVAGNIIAQNSNILAGRLSTTGNITANTGGYFVGDGTYLTNVSATLPANITGTSVSVTGNITGASIIGNTVSAANIFASGVISSAGAVVAQTNVNGAAMSVTGTITATTANVTVVSAAGNVTAGGFSTAGNITGLYYRGNGSLLTGIAGSYGNSDVATYLASGTITSNIITTGNIAGGNASMTGNVTANNLNATAVVSTVSVVSNYANITATGLALYVPLGSASITGNIVSSGNITGNYILGNGSQLTGLPATYGNANVAANLAAFGSNPISSTGNITTTANISANYYLGNGSQLTGITASLPANVTANVFTSQVYSYGNATGTITPDISLGSIQTMTLTGNITLNSLANVNTGQSATFIMTQDATGNRLLTSTWKFASNVRTLSTAANAIDMISVTYIGNTYYASLIRGFA